MDFLARVTIYLSLTMGIAIFTMFSLMAIPHIVNQYEDIWEDYQRSLEPEVIDEGLDEWISDSITVTEIPITRYDKADLVVCATLFDKLFDSYGKHIAENYGGPGQPILEPLGRTEIVMSWEGGQAFRYADCSQFVYYWGYLATHDAWNDIDWDLVSDLDVLTLEEN